MQRIDCLSNTGNDLPRSHVVVVYGLVNSIHVSGRMVLPDFNTSGIHQFGGISLGRSEEPANERA